MTKDGPPGRLVKRASRARREGRLADAHRDLVEAVAICRRAGTRRELARALGSLGQIERDLGHGDAARPLYEEAVAVCRAEGEPLALAHTLRHLGDLHREAGLARDAEVCYNEALGLYRSHKATAPLDLANAIRPLAILKEAAGEEDEARRLWLEARDLYQVVGVSAGVAECSARLARLGRH